MDPSNEIRKIVQQARIDNRAAKDTLVEALALMDGSDDIKVLGAAAKISGGVIGRFQRMEHQLDQIRMQCLDRET